MKKWFALLMAAVFSFTLAACGQSGTTSGTADSSAGGSQVASDDAQAEKDPITVVWLNSYNEDGIVKWAEWVKETVESQYDYITVQLETYSSDEIDTIVKTKIAGDDAPAIFGGFSEEEYVEAGYVYDLSGEDWVSNIQDDIIASGSKYGILSSVPMDTNYYGVFYNKDLFEEYNLEVPETLDELYAVCDTLVANDIAPFAAGFGDIWTLQEQFSPIYMTLCVGGYDGFEPNKTWYEDKETGASNFADDEAFARSAEIIYSLRDYFSEDPMATDWATALNMVATGKAAMAVNGSWTMDGVKSINPDINVSAFPMPLTNTPGDAVFVAQPGSGPLCFNSDDPEMLDATLKVFEVMYSVESGQNYAEWANKISTFKDVDMSFNTSFTDLMAYVADGKSWSNGDVTQFQGSGYSILQSRLQEFLMNDTMDVSSFLANMDSDFKAAR